MTDNTSVAIIGFGLIGQSWAVSFARAGCQVVVFDQDPALFSTAKSEIEITLKELHRYGLLWDQSPAEVSTRIRHAVSLEDAVSGATHVQENTPEIASIKTEIFSRLDAATPQEATIASSTSALLPSQFCGGLKGAERCLVAHPLNPPHLIPAVELVPNPETSDEAMLRAQRLMEAIGQTPILAKREVAGFIMNRLQGALLDEAFSLVSKDLACIEDVDTAVRDGLSRRWGFMGPFETIDLNAPGGIAAFMDRYGPAYAEIGKDRPNRPVWEERLQKTVTSARRAQLPENELNSRRAWRDRNLALSASLFNQLKSK